MRLTCGRDSPSGRANTVNIACQKAPALELDTRIGMTGTIVIFAPAKPPLIELYDLYGFCRFEAVPLAFSLRNVELIPTEPISFSIGSFDAVA